MGDGRQAAVRLVENLETMKVGSGAYGSVSPIAGQPAPRLTYDVELVQVDGSDPAAFGGVAIEVQSAIVGEGAAVDVVRGGDPAAVIAVGVYSSRPLFVRDLERQGQGVSHDVRRTPNRCVHPKEYRIGRVHDPNDVVVDGDRTGIEGWFAVRPGIQVQFDEDAGRDEVAVLGRIKVRVTGPRTARSVHH
ncbi:hypothetical protein [Rhodococcus sp. BE178]|uniref:hypothetical protein n=1 Tax=Rhodococcus sp. BE178 TaxID=2817737 RepID=UPI003D25ED1C